MISELDAAVPRAGAVVRIEQYGGGPDECFAVGNQRGYLRLGIEFLRAAYAPARNSATPELAVDLEYVLDPDAEVNVDWIERREDLQRGVSTSQQPQTWQHWFKPLLVVGVVGSFSICAMIGFVTLIRWFGPW